MSQWLDAFGAYADAVHAGVQLGTDGRNLVVGWPAELSLTDRYPLAMRLRRCSAEIQEMLTHPPTTTPASDE